VVKLGSEGFSVGCWGWGREADWRALFWLAHSQCSSAVSQECVRPLFYWVLSSEDKFFIEISGASPTITFILRRTIIFHQRFKLQVNTKDSPGTVHIKASEFNSPNY